MFSNLRKALKQGDPISLYLFILCVKGLSALLSEVEKSKKIKGVCITRGAPLINHMLFTDDSLLFGWANVNEWLQIQSLLGIYAEASG